MDNQMNFGFDEEYKSEDENTALGSNQVAYVKKVHTQELSRIFKSKQDIYEILVIEGKCICLH